jgi:predicted nuclease of restriction endonuclease-like RecB superfamily
MAADLPGHDLHRLVSRSQRGEIVPRYLLEHDHPWLRELVAEIRRFEGRPRRELRAALREVEVGGAHPAKVRVAACVLEELWVPKIRAAVPPPLAREALFVAGARSHDRAVAVREAAASLGIAADALEAALFADLPDERVLSPPARDASVSEIALRANLAMVTMLFKRATCVTVRAEGAIRPLVRSAKLRGLLCTVREGAGRGAGSLELSGPFALFRRTMLYGRALAALVPRAAWCPGVELRAECFLGDLAGPASELVVRAGDPLPVAPELAEHDSLVEARFARDFARAAPDWELVREPEAIAVGRTLLFPDFLLRHRRARERAWLVEIVGFWTADYLARKLERLREARIERLILCIDEELNVGEHDAPRDAAVVRYRRRVEAGAVLRVVDPCAVPVRVPDRRLRGARRSTAKPHPRAARPERGARKMASSPAAHEEAREEVTVGPMDVRQEAQCRRISGEPPGDLVVERSRVEPRAAFARARGLGKGLEYALALRAQHGADGIDEPASIADVLRDPAGDAAPEGREAHDVVGGEAADDLRAAPQGAHAGARRVDQGPIEVGGDVSGSARPVDCMAGGDGDAALARGRLELPELERDVVGGVHGAARAHLLGEQERLVAAPGAGVEHALSCARSQGERGELRALFLYRPRAAGADELAHRARAAHAQRARRAGAGGDLGARGGLAQPCDPRVALARRLRAEAQPDRRWDRPRREKRVALGVAAERFAEGGAQPRRDRRQRRRSEARRALAAFTRARACELAEDRVRESRHAGVGDALEGLDGLVHRCERGHALEQEDLVGAGQHVRAHARALPPAGARRKRTDARLEPRARAQDAVDDLAREPSVSCVEPAPPDLGVERRRGPSALLPDAYQHVRRRASRCARSRARLAAPRVHGLNRGARARALR